jgi:hypothetical protein
VLLVVVETKVAEDDDWQARNLNITGAKVVIAEGQEAIVLLWRDVLEALVALADLGPAVVRGNAGDP